MPNATRSKRASKATERKPAAKRTPRKQSQPRPPKHEAELFIGPDGEPVLKPHAA